MSRLTIRATDPEKVQLLTVLFALDPKLEMHGNQGRDPKEILGEYPGYRDVLMPTPDGRDSLAFGRNDDSPDFREVTLGQLLDAMGIKVPAPPPPLPRLADYQPRLAGEQLVVGCWRLPLAEVDAFIAAYQAARKS